MKRLIIFLALACNMYGAIAKIPGAHGFFGVVTTATSGPFNMSNSGAFTHGLIVIYQAGQSSLMIISDNQGNSYTALTESINVSQGGQLFYNCNAVLSSSQTFTLTQGGTNAQMFVQAYSGAKTSACFDTQSANNSAPFPVTTVQPGSVTPVAGELVITGGNNASTASTTSTYSVDSGFTITDQTDFVGGCCYGGAMADLIAIDGTPKNPTWTYSGAADRMMSAIATFIPAPSSGGEIIKHRTAWMH